MPNRGAHNPTHTPMVVRVLAGGHVRSDTPMVNTLGLSITEAAAEAGVGRSTVYVAISEGDLVARKVGRRTVILRDDLSRWLGGLPVISPKQRPSVSGSASAMARTARVV